MTATLFACFTLFAAGCGDSNERFESAEADRALAALDSLESAISEGRCNAAESRVKALIGQAQSINRDRPDLGAAYAESLDRLQSLVESECIEKRDEPTEPVTGETGSTDEPAEPTGQTAAPEPTGSPEPTAPAPQPTPETPPEDQSGGVQAE